MKIRTRIKLGLASLAIGVLISNCNDALQPTGDIVASLAQASRWPDTVSVAEIATVGAFVTRSSGEPILGVELEWGTSDSSVVTIAKVVAPASASSDEQLAAGLNAVVTTHAPGSANIIARLNRAGFAPAELQVPVTVAQRSWPALLTVSKIDTAGIVLTNAEANVVEGATVTWQTSDPSVLQVTRLDATPFRAQFTPRASGSVVITATATGSRLGRAVFQLPLNVGALRVAQASAWPTLLSVSDSTTVAVQVRDAQNQPLTGVPVQWRSTNVLALDVDATGKLRALSPGGTELIATAGAAGFQTSELRAVVSIGNLQVLEATNWPDTLSVTDTVRLGVIVRDAANIARPGVRVRWSSTNPVAFSVDSTGKVTALAQGGGQIVATVGEPPFQTSEHRATLSVLPLRVDAGTDWPDTLTVTDTVRLTAFVPGTSGPPPGVPVRWTSTNTFAFTVDATGMVIALNQGGGEIVATVGEPPFQTSERRASITVLPLRVDEFPQWPIDYNLANDTTLRVIVRDAFGKPRLGLRVQWRSTNTSVFTVDATGRVTPLRVGEGEVIASVGEAPFQASEHRGLVRVHSKWRTVDAGWKHTCGLAAADGAGSCWGSNRFGELGIGAALSFTGLIPRPISTGVKFDELYAGGDSIFTPPLFGGARLPEAHTCGRAGNSVLCWGAALSSQIGDGTEPCLPAINVSTSCTRSVPVSTINNGQFGTTTGVGVYSAAVGGRHTCAVIAIGVSIDNFITCWGMLDPRSSLSVPPQPVPFGFGSGPAQTSFFTPFGSQAAVATMAPGGAHVCIAQETFSFNEIRCFGNNAFGQTGAPDANVRNISGQLLFFNQTSSGTRHSCVINFGVLCWGSNASGQLGAPTPADAACTANSCYRALAVTLPEQAVALAAGGEHTCALGISGSAYCWGSNAYGQLGNAGAGGATPRLVSGGLKFLMISAGWGHTCGVTLDGSAYCWGLNDKGQLGDGTLISRAVPTRVGDPPP
jgi:uncharacterized protein YjdB